MAESTNESPKSVNNELLERLTLGVAKSLEKRLGVCDVSLKGGDPTERHQIVAWEQRNACMLPDDLKSFYLTTDGILLTWNVTVEGSTFPVGRMELNPFSKLIKISTSASTIAIGNTPSLADAESSSSDEDDSDGSDSNDESRKNKSQLVKPHFDGRSRIFEVENCQGYGKVCLVYLNTSPGLPAHKPEIWFLDRSLTWHFLATDFTSYYRLMLMHLGLPQWHLALTDLGLSLQAKQWFNMYAPVRLALDEKNLDVHVFDGKADKTRDTSQFTEHKIDFVKLFKGRSSDRGKTKVQGPAGQMTNKKKPFQQNFSTTASTKSGTSSRTMGRVTKPWA